jgi:hypothetical protein
MHNYETLLVRLVERNLPLQFDNADQLDLQLLCDLGYIHRGLGCKVTSSGMARYNAIKKSAFPETAIRGIAEWFAKWFKAKPPVEQYGRNIIEQAIHQGYNVSVFESLNESPIVRRSRAIKEICHVKGDRVFGIWSKHRSFIGYIFMDANWTITNYTVTPEIVELLELAK